MPAASAPIHDAHRSADAFPLRLALTVAASVVALGAVMVGFALVAVSLADVWAVPLPWGAGLCVGGAALAAATRGREARSPSGRTAPEPG